MDIKEYLNKAVDYYNQPFFIESDPIQIPHQFSKKEDIEIAGILTATISWGNRKAILKGANSMMELLHHSPYDFILNHRSKDLKPLADFVYRTFNGTDLISFVEGLKHIYLHHGGLEALFARHQTTDGMMHAIHAFKLAMFEVEHLPRTEKHISDPHKGSAAKRINMFLRWMVRNDKKGVDFGIWNKISPSILHCPLDVHSGNTARSLGLLHRKQNDLKAVLELDAALRSLDPMDPVKYDFALFGIGVFEKLEKKFPFPPAFG